MQQVYVCNVDPNVSNEVEPLGLPSMSFEDTASVSPRQTHQDSKEGDNTTDSKNADDTQQPLGLPKLDF